MVNAAIVDQLLVRAVKILKTLTRGQADKT